MLVRVFWDDDKITNLYCDSICWKQDYKTIVIYIGNEHRCFYLDDIKKIVVKGDN